MEGISEKVTCERPEGGERSLAESEHGLSTPGREQKMPSPGGGSVPGMLVE